MIKEFKCLECQKIQEISIHTSDIVDSRGKLNLDEYTKRLKEDRLCECGGLLKNQFTTSLHMIDDPYFREGCYQTHPKYTSDSWNTIHNRNKYGI